MRVAVYGAGGSLGTRVVDRLAAANAALVLIGRQWNRLLETASIAPRSEVITASVDDARALAAALAGCDVVVNCAPAGATALSLARAAIGAGVDYVDAAGEQHVIRQLFDELRAAARQSRSAIVTAMGFDYAIGDCLARIAAADNQPLDQLTMAYAIEGPDVRENSAEAAAAGPRPEVVYRDGRWRPLPFELDRATFDFGEPFGRRQMSRYGSGEVITVPRHTQTRTVLTLITSTSLCPYPALLPIFPLLRPLISLALRTPARALLRRQRRADVAPDSPERRFAVVAEARGVDGRICRATATGGDFHDVTTALLALGAKWLADGHEPGVFSPATAFEPRTVLDSIAQNGVSWKVGDA